MKMKKFKHIFVDEVPENIKSGTLYVCLSYNIVVHKCACGCNETVALPLAPDQWSLYYNGHDITLTPSIGNWSYKCKSHYYIKNNYVEWAPQWSDRRIQKHRNFIKRKKNRKFKFLNWKRPG